MRWAIYDPLRASRNGAIPKSCANYKNWVLRFMEGAIYDWKSLPFLSLSKKGRSRAEALFATYMRLLNMIYSEWPKEVIEIRGQWKNLTNSCIAQIPSVLTT